MRYCFHVMYALFFHSNFASILTAHMSASSVQQVVQTASIVATHLNSESTNHVTNSDTSISNCDSNIALKGCAEIETPLLIQPAVNQSTISPELAVCASVSVDPFISSDVPGAINIHSGTVETAIPSLARAIPDVSDQIPPSHMVSRASDTTCIVQPSVNTVPLLPESTIVSNVSTRRRRLVTSTAVEKMNSDISTTSAILVGSTQNIAVPISVGTTMRHVTIRGKPLSTSTTTQSIGAEPYEVKGVAVTQSIPGFGASVRSGSVTLRDPVINKS